MICDAKSQNDCSWSCDIKSLNIQSYGNNHFDFMMIVMISKNTTKTRTISSTHSNMTLEKEGHKTGNFVLYSLNQGYGASQFIFYATPFI